MISLARVPGIQPDLSVFLADAGVHTANDLARMDAVKLQHDLSMIARKRGKGSSIPSFVNVKLWIQAAQETIAKAEPVSIDDIPEAVSLDEIPEAEIDFESIPEAEPQSLYQHHASINSGGQPVDRRLPVRESLKLMDDGEWKGLDRDRLQSLDSYVANERGIEPLRRSASSASPRPARLTEDSETKASRYNRKGVLYPFPMRAILGATVSLLWRLAMLGTFLGLPVYLALNHGSEDRPTTIILSWLGAFFALGFLQLWVISMARCRVCSCELFISKRCFKNRRAHLLPGIGYVASLSLHLLLFQWFRCMYCGTAIRLFGGSSRAAREAIVQDAEAGEQA